MTPPLLPRAILRAAALLAPREQRAEWLAAWRSELWYIPPAQAVRFSLGAFSDALWLRRHRERPWVPLESPLACLAFLAAAAVSLCLVVCLSAPLKLNPLYSGMRARDLPAGCLATLGFSCLMLPAALAAARAPASHSAMPWVTRLRRGVFFLLKFALVQPILMAAIVIWILIAPVAPIAPYLLCAACILTLRWVFADQRRRCPVCLRLLTEPVRIGTVSRTFLEWHGAESVCARGHGMLDTPALSASYCGRAEWLGLDESWSELFREPAELRPR